jgi:hypothetical protein
MAQIILPSPLYRLKRIQGQQIVLQTDRGALRVLNASDIKLGHASSNNVRLLTSTSEYTIALEDYFAIRHLLN